MNNQIKRLQPSAARLLLALIAAGEYAHFEDVVQSSGIHACKKLREAREQLIELGFLIVKADGKEYVCLKPDLYSSPLAVAQV